MKIKFSYAIYGIALVLGVASLSGCAKFMGNLRRDLDDSDPNAMNEPPAVVGGRWSERGFLSQEMPEGGYGSDRYASVGHSERSPASGMGAPGFSGARSWVSPEGEETNRRDMYRKADGSADDAPGVAYSNTAAVDPPIKRKYKNGSRATRADFVDESQNEGSLWASDGQTNYYFTKNKIRGVGDIITLTVEPELSKDVIREVARSLSPKEKEAELNAAQDKIRARYLGIPYVEPFADDKDPKKNGTQDAVTASAAAPARTPADTDKKKKEEIDEDKIPSATAMDIDLSRAVEIKPGDLMMGEIIERYPNGNYKIRAVKKVPYKRGSPRLVTLVGVVRGVDITEEDTVTSGKLYEYRLEAVR